MTGQALITLLALLSAGPLLAQTAPETPAVRDVPREARKPGWVLTFHDEFNDRKLDRTKWMDQYPEGRTHGDEEHEWYAPDAFEFGRGFLRLKAEKREMNGKPYTSGMISSWSHFAQQYGWYEIRARFPKGKGYWPAFWLIPDDRSWPPEIDVLEILGHEPNKVYMTNHFKNAEGKHEGFGGNWVGPDFSAGWHKFAVDWEPGLIVWYVDGVERFRSTKGVPEQPFYVIANLAVGGSWGGYPDETTRFPGYMDIDYIRVYRKADK